MAINAQTKEWVDLGLPSGTLWANMNEDGGYYNFDQAVAKFGDNLPTKAQLEELKSSCKWTWMENGYNVVGPSGKSLFLPAAGLRGRGDSVFFVGFYGQYWSSTPFNSGNAWFLAFYPCEVSSLVNVNHIGCRNGLSVRLVRRITPTGYVDLGLPSGTLWKSYNEQGLYTYDQAVAKFGNKLPTKEQFEELKKYCTWTGESNGIRVKGSNGHSIYLPPTDGRTCNGTYNSATKGGTLLSSTLRDNSYPALVEALNYGTSQDWVWISGYYLCVEFAIRLVY